MTLSIPELRALAAAATEGPWRWGDWRTEFGLLESEFRDTLEFNPSHPGEPNCITRKLGAGKAIRVLVVEDEIGDGDRAFIAASRTAIPALLDRIEALEVENEQLKANNLRAALREALAIAHEGWGWAIAHEGWDYAPAYFRDKWMDLKRLAELAKLVEGKNDR